MSTFRRRLICNASKLFDLSLIVVCFAVAAGISLHSPALLRHMLWVQMPVSYFALFTAFLIVSHWIYSTLELYDTKRLAPRMLEAIDVTKATTATAVLLAIAIRILRPLQLNHRFVFVFWILLTTCAVLSRLTVRTMLAAVRRRGRNSRQMLIVGTNARAIEFAQKIEASPHLGYHIVGFSDTEWQGSNEFQKTGYSVVADLSSLAHFVRVNVVDEVVLALPVGSFHGYSSEVASACEEQGIITRILPDLFDLKVARRAAEELEGDTVITLYTGARDGWSFMAKRVLDFVISVLLIVILSPVLIAVAIAIKVDSKGPILFRQQRLGLNKRRFHMCKFRTMCVDAEQRMAEVEHLNEQSGPVFKITNDPRVTRVGRFLRKTSIDELPQLFNVLKGEMSLVGPRPLDTRDYELMTRDCRNWQRCRFSVPPGITCLWQVSGRNSLPFERWMELDREYVHGWSLWLDCKILLKTIPAVLKGSGAA